MHLAPALLRNMETKTQTEITQIYAHNALCRNIQKDTNGNFTISYCLLYNSTNKRCEKYLCTHIFVRFLDWVSGDRDKEVEMWVICLALPLEQQAEISQCICPNCKMCLFQLQNVFV